VHFQPAEGGEFSTGADTLRPPRPQRPGLPTTRQLGQRIDCAGGANPTAPRWCGGRSGILQKVEPTGFEPVTSCVQTSCPAPVKRAIEKSPRGSPAPCQPEDERNRPQGRRRWVPRQVPARSRQVCLASPSAWEVKRAGFARPICRGLQHCLAGERGEKEIGARIRANASFRRQASPGLSDYRAGTMPRSQRPAPLVLVSSRRPRCGSLLSAIRHAPIVGRCSAGHRGSGRAPAACL
jgi:hypothetical protein